MPFTSVVILLSGIVAGATLGLVLHFIWVTVRQPGKDLLRLWKRKRHLAAVVTLAAIALSLGTAMITAFLGWGANFLDDTSRPIAEELAGAGGAYWGGMLTILTLIAFGFTASCLHDDIHKAAIAWAEAERQRLIEAQLSLKRATPPTPAAPSDIINLALEWKKKNDLDFDPLKTIGTVVAALGPVLTSVFITALSSSLAD